MPLYRPGPKTLSGLETGHDLGPQRIGQRYRRAEL
jgi:hypothetical protein